MVNGVASRGGPVGELTRLMETFHQATEKLARSYEKIEELQRELADRDRRLARKTRLETLGRMAAGLAHEIRNPLAGIQLYATMLSEDLADRPDSRATVEKIRGGVRRLETLVGQVLHFTREIKPQPVECDVVPLLVESVELARARTRSERVRVVLEHPQSLRARVDPQLLSQAMLNLLLNALEAVGGDGTVRDFRERISALDRSIVEAMNARIELVAELKRYKEEHGLPFLDPERERQLLEALERANRGPLSREGLRELVTAVLELTKREVARERS